MKLAIVLRGISYWNETEKVSESKIVNYELCLEMMKKHLIEPLKVIFDQIDFFIVTYNNSKLEKLLVDFSPKDILIYPKSWINKFKHVISTKLISDSVEMIEKYNYDNILITRFDLFYYKPLNINKINIQKFNFGWIGESGQSDDSWLLFPTKFIPCLKSHLERNNSPSAHYINRSVSPDDCNYLCVLIPDEGYHMPDFYYFYRYKEQVDSGNMKLY